MSKCLLSILCLCLVFMSCNDENKLNESLINLTDNVDAINLKTAKAGDIISIRGENLISNNVSKDEIKILIGGIVSRIISATSECICAIIPLGFEGGDIIVSIDDIEYLLGSLSHKNGCLYGIQPGRHPTSFSIVKINVETGHLENVLTHIINDGQIEVGTYVYDSKSNQIIIPVSSYTEVNYPAKSEYHNFIFMMNIQTEKLKKIKVDKRYDLTVDEVNGKIYAVSKDGLYELTLDGSLNRICPFHMYEVHQMSIIPEKNQLIIFGWISETKRGYSTIDLDTKEKTSTAFDHEGIYYYIAPLKKIFSSVKNASYTSQVGLYEYNKETKKMELFSSYEQATDDDPHLTYLHDKGLFVIYEQIENDSKKHNRLLLIDSSTKDKKQIIINSNNYKTAIMGDLLYI